MAGDDHYLGLVINGELHQLWSTVRNGLTPLFTRVYPQEAKPPETGVLDLRPHERCIVLIVGQQQGGWVYSAEVVDKAGATLSVTVGRWLAESAKGLSFPI